MFRRRQCQTAWPVCALLKVIGEGVTVHPWTQANVNPTEQSLFAKQVLSRTNVHNGQSPSGRSHAASDLNQHQRGTALQLQVKPVSTCWQLQQALCRCIQKHLVAQAGYPLRRWVLA